jgi:hypothetical protein
MWPVTVLVRSNVGFNARRGYESHKGMEATEGPKRHTAYPETRCKLSEVGGHTRAIAGILAIGPDDNNTVFVSIGAQQESAMVVCHSPKSESLGRLQKSTEGTLGDPLRGP